MLSIAIHTMLGLLIILTGMMLVCIVVSSSYGLKSSMTKEDIEKERSPGLLRLYYRWLVYRHNEPQKIKELFVENHPVTLRYKSISDFWATASLLCVLAILVIALLMAISVSVWG